MDEPLPVIYILDASVAVTGAVIAARNEARALKETVRMVLVLPRGSTVPPAELQDFWRVEHIPLVHLSKNLSAMLRYFPALLVGTWRLKKLMRRDGAMRLQLNDFYLMHGAVLRLLGFRGRIVTWLRCHPAAFAGPLARPLLALARISANRMVAVSAFTAAFLPPHPPAAILYDCYTGPTRPPGIWTKTDSKPFVYIGNYIAGKGQDMALAAFALAAAQDPTITLHFHGGDMGLQKNRDYRAQLEIAAQQNGLGERITFSEFVADTYSVLEPAYAALNFSRSESFSMTVLEASGAGLPVIATASGGPQEIIEDGFTGYLIPVGDPEAAATRILELARNPDAATAMGQEAATHIRRTFNERGFCKQLQEILGVK